MQHTVEVDFTKKPITDAELKELTGLKGVTTLILTDTQITDAAFPDIARYPHLTILDVTGTKISGVGAAELAKLKQLTEFKALECPVSDAGIKELAGLGTLTTLHLGKVTATGVKELARLKNLRHLALGWGNGVTAETIDELQKALPDCGIYKAEGRFFIIGKTIKVTEAGPSRCPVGCCECAVDV